MEFERIDIEGNQDLGVFGAISEEYAIVPRELDEKLREVIGKTLDVKIISSSIDGSSLIGSLTEINSNGIIVSETISEDEINNLKETNLDIEFISGLMNASGNLVVSNNKKALVHPDISDEDKQKIEDTLNVDVLPTQISGVKNVGAAVALNNKGALIHSKVDDEKIKEIEDFLGIPTGIGTVNHGSPMVGSGILTNDKGFLVGSRTTGHELGRIENTLFGEEE